MQRRTGDAELGRQALHVDALAGEKATAREAQGVGRRRLDATGRRGVCPPSRRRSVRAAAYRLPMASDGLGHAGRLTRPVGKSQREPLPPGARQPRGDFRRISLPGPPTAWYVAETFVLFVARAVNAREDSLKTHYRGAMPMSAPLLVRRSSFRTVVVVVGLVALVGAVASSSVARAATVIVTTDSGPVEGLVTPTMTEFLGVPFAAPPTGDLRWQPPQPPVPWTTPRDATVFGNHCPQLPSDFGLPSDTEDCLVLNVYVPVRHGFPSDSRRNRPVMVWIHGGAFSVGESDVYDPTRLVAQDVIVITINYRLGAL